MRKRLTDQEIKTIIARYLEGKSMRSLARRFDMAPSTVKQAIDRSVDIVELARCKQEENTVEMLEFMGDRRAKAQSFIDLCLESLQDGEKLEKASLQQIATSLAIIVDKFTVPQRSEEATQDDRLQQIAEQLQKYGKPTD